MVSDRSTVLQVTPLVLNLMTEVLLDNVLKIIQGCCASKPETHDDEGSRAITSGASQPLESIPPHPSPLVSAPSRSSRRRQPPTIEHTPPPLRPHIWTSKRQWTRSQLIKEREEFFDTRVTGHPDVWETLKVVVDLLAAGNTPLAQSVVDAAEITIPTGDLKNGAYDHRGNLYQMPEYVISDPLNVIHDAPSKEAKEASSVEGSDDEGEAERRREEKGKGVAVEEDTVLVKARLSDRGGPDIAVQIARGHTIRWLIQRIQEEAGVSWPGPLGEMES